MTTERTLAIIKPGAVARGLIGTVETAILNAYFTIAEKRPLRFTEEQAKEFYAEHTDKPFFAGLVEHTCSGPCLALVLEGQDAVVRWRQLMGPTAPAACGREHLRWHVGGQLPDNGLHGSATPEDAEREINLVFPVAVVPEDEVTRLRTQVKTLAGLLREHIDFPSVGEAPTNAMVESWEERRAELAARAAAALALVPVA